MWLVRFFRPKCQTLVWSECIATQCLHVSPGLYRHHHVSKIVQYMFYSCRALLCLWAYLVSTSNCPTTKLVKAFGSFCFLRYPRALRRLVAVRLNGQICHVLVDPAVVNATLSHSRDDVHWRMTLRKLDNDIYKHAVIPVNLLCDAFLAIVFYWNQSNWKTYRVFHLTRLM